MSQENVEVVQHMIDAFNRGDVAAVISAFDESCEVFEPPEMPDTPTVGFRGHDGVRDWMTNIREVMGVQFEPRTFTDSGDAVLSELTGRGLGQASEAPVEWTTFAVLHMRAGKIVRAEAFLGRGEALEAAGLSE
jgi:ketosteroid isomerase-like protein